MGMQQSPYGSGPPPPPPGSYPQGQGASYQKPVTPPNAQKYNMQNHGASSSSQNNSFNAPTNFDFSDKTIRKHFICKVYSILMCQLLITFILVAVAIFHEPTKMYINTRPWLSIIAMVLSFSILISLACCENVRRKSPLNFILLLVFTLSMSFLIAVTVSRNYPEHVLMALGITVLICFSLSVFAFQTKIDFTVMGGFLLVALIVFFIASIVYMFFPGKLFNLIISSIGVILFSLYLLYDTQMMMGGNHKYSISPEEYIFAALTIYIDVINIFLYILAIISGTSDD